MRLLVFIFLSLLTSLAMAGQTYLLAFADAPGSTRAYQLDFTVNGKVDASSAANMPFALSFQAVMAEEVLAHPEGGPARVEQTLRNGVISGKVDNTRLFEAIPTTSVVVNRTARGATQLVEMKSAQAQKSDSPFGALGGGLQSMGQMSGGFEFPPLPLAVGNSWGTKRTFPFLPGSTIAFTTDNTVTGTKMVAGREYVVLTTDIAMTIPQTSFSFDQGGQGFAISGDMAFTGKAFTLFDCEAGELFRTTFKGKIDFKVKAADNTKQENVRGTLSMHGTMTKLE